MPSKHRKQQQQLHRSNNNPVLLRQSSSDNSLSSSFNRSDGLGHLVTSLSVTGDIVTGNGGNGCHLNLSAKEQQQLERNNYLLGLTKEQLKVECRKRGQKLTGTKDQLV